MSLFREGTEEYFEVARYARGFTAVMFLNGVIIATPISDVLAFVIAALFLYSRGQ